MRFERQLKAILHARLLEDMHQMDFDGSDGDGKLAGDLLVLHSPANEGDDFVLAWREPRQVAAIEETDYLIGNRILDPDVTASHRAKTLDHGGDGKCFFQNAAHTALESSKGLDFGNRCDPKNGVAVQRAHPDLWYQFESRFITGRLVEQNNI